LDAGQLALQQRLEHLVERFSGRSLQDMLDFDHLGEDGLDNSHSNHLAGFGADGQEKA